MLPYETTVRAQAHKLKTAGKHALRLVLFELIDPETLRNTSLDDVFSSQLRHSSPAAPTKPPHSRLCVFVFFLPPPRHSSQQRHYAAADCNFRWHLSPKCTQQSIIARRTLDVWSRAEFNGRTKGALKKMYTKWQGWSDDAKTMPAAEAKKNKKKTVIGPKSRNIRQNKK